MARKATNDLLQKAKKLKNDEFYTQISDIEKELQYYKAHFEGKIVYCNCDDPYTSNFFKYFVLNFQELKIKKVIASCYKEQTVDLFDTENFENGYFAEYAGDKIKINYFKGDGDFRSMESIELLKQSDIVVTNPPFSLFRDYVAQLVKYQKKFLIIGNINAITYKEIFKLIQDNRAWLGVHLGRGIVLTKSYFGNEKDYPKYDNYDGIHIDKTQNIPLDYNGYMGVPITFLHKFNPDQFEIVKFRKGNNEKDLSINGKCPYFRILIRNKRI